jgi:hypothetical protein
LLTCWPPAPCERNGVDPDLVPVQLDLDVVADLRQDLDEGERRLRPLLGVERADPDEAVDAALGPQPAVGRPAVDLDGRALDAGLLAFLLIDDLGLEAVALGPAEVHPEEHLGPVGRLGAARAGADREDRAALVVLAGEEEGRPLALEVALEGGRGRSSSAVSSASPDSSTSSRVARRSSTRVSKPRQQLDLGTEAVGLAQDLLGGSLVVPEAGLERQRVELATRVPSTRGQRRPEVDRIRSARSRTVEASTQFRGLEVLSRIGRSSIEAQGRLAPGDDGVHAGGQ